MNHLLLFYGALFQHYKLVQRVSAPRMPKKSADNKLSHVTDVSHVADITLMHVAINQDIAARIEGMFNHNMMLEPRVM